MSVQFTEENHTYTSIDPGDDTKWTSVTSLIGQFKQPFDKELMAKKCSEKKTNNKYKGLTPDEIIAIWDKESKRSTDLGSWFHKEQEKVLLGHDTIGRIDRDGNERHIPIFPPVEKNGIKIASSQQLIEGIYPEHLVYLKSVGISGQADRVEVVGDEVKIYDFKTNKEIKTKAFTNWQGSAQMMSGPCSHLEDCHINHYALQLSLYMYMILKHNPYLNPGKLEILHVVFEVEDYDKYGYPITKYNEQDEPIVKEVVPYNLDYLQQEIFDIINYHKNHNK